MTEAVGLRTHYCGELRAADIGQTVSVCGWVAKRREHGEHLAFVDLRDHTGVLQCVVHDDTDVRSEYVLRITGTAAVGTRVFVRDGRMISEAPELPTVEIEI